MSRPKRKAPKNGLTGFKKLPAGPAKNGSHHWDGKTQRQVERRLGQAFRKTVRELERCYHRSRQEQKRISAILRELGRALRNYRTKGLR